MSQASSAYPEDLRRAEAHLFRARPKWQGGAANPAGEAPTLVGVGISGGGVRSATFALGVFQALARLRKLGQIDYISTVSGGGYFGSAYGRLFTRSSTTSIQDVEKTLDHIPETPFISWLRENGRYLAPRGGGDLLLALAGTVRNLVTVQMLLLIVTLASFCLAQLVRHAAIGLAPDGYLPWLQWTLPGGIPLWGSAYVAVPIAIAAACVVPLGWAFWALPSDTRGARPSFWTVLGMVLVAVAGGWGGFRFRSDDAARWPWFGAAVIAVLTIVVVLATLVWLRRLRAGATSAEEILAANEKIRHALTTGFKRTLVVAVAVAGFALVDSLGQTFYALSRSPSSKVEQWLGGALAALATIATFVGRFAPLLRGGNGKSKAKRGLLPIAASTAAVVVCLVALTAVDTASHGIAWRLGLPGGCPPNLCASPDAVASTPACALEKCFASIGAGAEALPVPAPAPRPDAAGAVPASAAAPLGPLATATLFLLVLAAVTGRSWPLLNFSSQLPMYRARLTRAYLGASNARRHSGEPESAIVNVIADDDMPLDEYYALDEADGRERLFGKGAPLHLINVTINETIEGRSQVERLDRKGVPLAVGPCGMSAGVRHHVVRNCHDKALTTRSGGYRVFDYEPGKRVDEPMSLGHWLAISGAAFSTGIGYRTSIGLSLLAGLANVRLGYWWDSGTKRSFWSRKRGMFPVQTYLFDELLARFRGTAERFWYLSDGGHFENLGGYELVRRRLPLIVLIDGEADPDLVCSGLSDLTMKARVDFSAEIEFVDEKELDRVLHPELRKCFGTLDQLRRGSWEKTLGPADQDERRALGQSDHQRFSWRHAALGRVHYVDPPQVSWLVYIKASMTGDEPLDVLQYHRENPAFPHQTTGDQFFDERQWESYRKLGDHIAEQVFADHAPVPDRWQAGRFTVPSTAKA